VLVGVRAFPVGKVILLFEPRQVKQAQSLHTKLEAEGVEVERREVGPPLLTSVLATMAVVVQEEAVNFQDVVVNVSNPDKMFFCSLLSGAFVHGLKAIAVQDGTPIQLPVLKFSYSEMISESKMNILRALQRAGGGVDSLNMLSEMSGVEKSLLSYHIRGGRDAKGLEELGLVSIERAKQGRLIVSLTEMGNLMLLGGEQMRPTAARKGGGASG
jgi:DNA-binding transcriptional ArsR family regulator